MLTFFRRIRKGLLGDGATSKYLLYAVGEIALVVIGILIALQINDWNTNRIERKEEAEYLERIVDELKSDNEHLKNAQTALAMGLESTYNILDFWNSTQPIIKDSLQFINGFKGVSNPSLWYHEPVVWTQLIQTGDLKLIQDKALIESLFAHYSEMKRIASNFSGYPYSQITEARKLWTDVFINFKINQYTNKNPAGPLQEVPDAIVFERIKNSSQKYEALFTNLTVIYGANFNSIQRIIDSGEKILEEVLIKSGSR